MERLTREKGKNEVDGGKNERIGSGKWDKTY